MRRKRIIIFLLVLFFIVISCFLYVNDYYPSDLSVQEYLQKKELVSVIEIEEGYYFDGIGETDAMIFYPGAKVEYTAYLPFLYQLAEQGMDCFLVKMPYNLAIFGKDKAEGIIDRYHYQHWYLSGHSLGGAMAASYVSEHIEELDGLILLAAYPTKSLKSDSLSVVSIYGSEDGILNREKLEEGRENMPTDYSEFCIEGGNHAGFGEYGKQKGDGEAKITSKEQQQNTIEIILQMIDQKKLVSQAEDIYKNSIQNLCQGNSITYADGYYYFRSQLDYSLCRSKGTGEKVEKLADQMPAEIYVTEDHIYFINASDSQTLYCIGTDGSNLTKLGDFSMQHMIVVEKRIYFLSVYEREEDPFYQLLEEEAEGDRYLYSVNLDGSDCRLLVSKVCKEFTTDGRKLYYTYDKTEGQQVLCCNQMEGGKEEVIWQGKEPIFDLVSYQGKLYANVEKEKQWYFAQLEEEERDWKCLEEGDKFLIADGIVYLYNQTEILYFDLKTREKQKNITICIGENKRENGFRQERNEGIFFVDNSLFCRSWESEEKGILWHIWDKDIEQFTIFEDIKPFSSTELVRDTSWNTENLFYTPGQAEDTQYLDGELNWKEHYGIKEDGSEYGIFSLRLPLFGEEIQGKDTINHQIREVEQLAFKDRDTFFQLMQEEQKENGISWYRRHDYSNLYVGEQYLSFFYYIEGYNGGVRIWRQAVPLTFDRETGKCLTMDEFFTVDRTVYMNRLSSAIYKYSELVGENYIWNEGFDKNVLVKHFKPNCFYLTPDGIVLCYERYAVVAGAGGNPTFEIPYSWFEDIWIKK